MVGALHEGSGKTEAAGVLKFGTADRRIQQRSLCSRVSLGLRVPSFRILSGWSRILPARSFRVSSRSGRIPVPSRARKRRCSGPVRWYSGLNHPTREVHSADLQGFQ